MKNKIKIKDIFGKVLFTYECEYNSMKKTVEEAVKQKISLYCADLNGVDLRGADLNYVNLNDAKVCGADLSGANLYGANLRGADLCCANLNDANLCCSNLSGADLNGANLRGANLCDAELRATDFWSANLRGANLCGANLRGAYLCDTDLCGVNLRWSNLYGAELNGAKNIPFIPLACPNEGSFIAWKKVNNCIVKLFIPEDAKRSSATTNKCRCDKAKVLEIINLETNEHIDEIVNKGYMCVYKVGEMAYPDKFDDNRWDECSNGIHFFVNKQEAIEYRK